MESILGDINPRNRVSRSLGRQTHDSLMAFVGVRIGAPALCFRMKNTGVEIHAKYSRKRPSFGYLTTIYPDPGRPNLLGPRLLGPLVPEVDTESGSAGRFATTSSTVGIDLGSADFCVSGKGANTSSLSTGASGPTD